MLASSTIGWRKAEDATYVVLASSSYSGSTLLSLLLGEHPEIATTSDVSGRRRSTRMERWVCSCGRLMLECAFWQRVAHGMQAVGYPDFELADFRAGFDVGSNALSRRIRTGSLRWNRLERIRDGIVRGLWPGHERELMAVAGRTEALARVVMADAGAHVFVDASKERLRIRHLSRYVRMALRVIHLVRDPRGVVDSTMRHRDGSRETVETAARRWVATNRSIMRLRAELPPGSWMQVRYEDLCADVGGTMRSVYAFCGVRAEYPVTDPRRELHILGNQMRLASRESISPDERWRTGLTEEQQDSVLRIADPVLRLLAAE
jgi:hypothetical protein